MGEVLQFSSINNLRVLLSNEGFHNAHIVYLGGLWVMIELKSCKTKSKFMQHSDSDVVSNTYFGDNGEDQGLEHQQGESSNAKEVSSDPSNIYGLLDKRLGSKAKKDWIRELISKHKVSFLSIQETKMESVSAM
nr:RNA-directed DNA polymerase, eukaryota [Tanacetum cinerariifolium]